MRIQGLKSPFSNRRGLIILYNFIRKERISNALYNCYQVNPLFQKFLDPDLHVASVSFGVTRRKWSGYARLGRFRRVINYFVVTHTVTLAHARPGCIRRVACDIQLSFLISCPSSIDCNVASRPKHSKP